MRLRPGDLAIARGPAPYTCGDTPDTAPQAVILPGGECQYPDGTPLNGSMDLGVRTWGDRLDGSTVMFIGTYLMRGEINGRLLDALPPLLTLPSEVWQCPLTPLLMEETVRDEPAQEVVLDRLLDLLVIAALRAWFSRPEAEAPAWYRAQADPVVGRVLRLLQDDPAHPWTVASLAAKAGVSRAALARRFTDLVGEPPMSYLTHRLAPRSGRRPPPRHPGHHRRDRETGRLRQRLRPVHRLQTGLRREPAGAPDASGIAAPVAARRPA